jgi:glycosyltransferase involved in cell wall biosynthesis
LAAPSPYPSISLIGHPFAPIGMGEHVRCSFRAFARAAVDCTVMDIYGLSKPEEAQWREFSPHASSSFADINIFHINGDEVQQAMAHVTYNTPLTGYNIVYPAWELSRYPKEWAQQLDRFDEIWAPSRFIADCLRAACSKPVLHMPIATEVSVQRFLSRRSFGLADQDCVFLFFFDLKSYIQRKNPQAVLRAFRRVLDLRPFARARLVIKVNGFDAAEPTHAAFRDEVMALEGRARLLTDTLTDDETKNLVRLADCFVSLHRSEGFGRGIAEAMVLGRPVIATAYSGNLDFMAPEASLPVPCTLVPVAPGEYPHHEGQVWAEPDTEAAAAHMVWLLDNPQAGRELGARARIHMMKSFTYRPTGVRYRDRIDAIRQARALHGTARASSSTGDHT